ncbi:aldehyde dehydrogenase family protein [Paenibacillus sp. EPM92]|uniref:aldehyde dehydrogenase family protein n=1 Tax=Paenibacillus sp. EPM92 TaxID=1561195 RepID=UPI001914EDC6|nr:aldehyde dehydrogenase family protein [Paenibacillus sp. EPM92]
MRNAQHELSDPLKEIRETKFYPMLIDGQWVESKSGKWMDVFNPADGELLAKVPAATAEDVNEAVQAASRALKTWKHTPPMQRGRLLLKLADLLEENIDYLAAIDAIDSGNPVSAMKTDIVAAARQIRYFAGLVLEMKGDTLPFGGTMLHSTFREPYGVVARIIPFNHPIMFAAGKIAAPLAAGNTVVLKPADQTPISPLIFGKLVNQILPPGVLNIITGDGQHAGDALVRHPEIKRIAFTGGSTTGRKVLQTAAERMKVVSLELGGKNPMLVFPDADLKEVVKSAVKGMNFDVSQGQSCGSTSKIFVHESMYPDFVRQLAEEVEKIKLGIPSDPGCQMGALISEAHLQQVDGFVKRAVAEGARVVTGGSREKKAPFDKGYFYLPTVLDQVTPEMEIAVEEIFGPVIAVIPWKNEEDVLQLANDSEYGLTASIWTNDIRRAYRIATCLETGYIWINDSSSRFMGTPFGGYKQSGIGVENSIEEMLSYTQIKTINVSL